MLSFHSILPSVFKRPNSAHWKTILMVLSISFLTPYAMGQFKTRIYNIHYSMPFSQKVIYNQETFGTKDLSFGGNVCVGNKYINTILEYNFHRMDAKQVIGAPARYVKIHEFLFGLRYYNARPTFLVGSAAFRLTAGLSGGFDLDLQTRSEYFVGFAITGIREPSGILIQGFYHRSANPTQGYQIKPYYGIRLGFVIGPTSN